MNIIYLHGFQSNSLSAKGQLLQQYCEQKTNFQVHLPDLNVPPLQALQAMSTLIQRLEHPVLVGSSLGGFYAMQLVVQHALPAVLINPAMQPWHLFRQLFATAQLPYAVTEHWSLDESQLEDLAHLAVSEVPNAHQILVLLQQGDEVLDAKDAQCFFSQPKNCAMIINEMQGTHGMDNFAEKIPMALQFLSDHLRKM